MDNDWKELGVERTVVDGEEVTMRICMARIEDLSYDGCNARLYNTRMEKYGGRPLTHDESFNELWKISKVKQLYQSIRTAGGLTDSLIVFPDGKVHEGNERLTCLLKIKDLLEQGGEFNELEVERLSNLMENIPVRVLPDTITERQLTMMLASIHLGGRHQWDPFNQANQIHKMFHEHGVPVEEIANTLRKSRPWVYQKLTAYEWCEEHLSKHQTWGNTKAFSYFEEAYKKKKMLRNADFDIENDEKMEMFSEFVANRTIPRALDVRKLHKVLEHDNLRELLFQGKGKEAFAQLAIYDAEETSPRFAAIGRLNKQLTKMTFDDYRILSNKDGPHRKLIADTILKLEKTLKTVDSIEEW